MKLKKDYPTSTEIRVVIYQGSKIDNDNAYPDSWYRDSIVFLDGGFLSELVKLDKTMSKVSRVRCIFSNIN